MPAAAPRISVAVPTCRRPQLLMRCLRALLAQTLPRSAFEIIVVDDGHDRETRLAVQTLARLLPPQFLHYTRPGRGAGPAVARNWGWHLARAPLLAFTDDDTVPAADWLAQGESAMRQGPWLAVGGRVVVPPLVQPQAAPSDHELMTRGLQHAAFVTANAFIRKSALRRIGGFDERFRRAGREDSDLQFRLQRLGPVGRCESAQVLQPARPERWGVSLRQQKNVFYDALLYRKHPRRYRSELRPMPPWDYYLTVLFALSAAALLVGGHAALATLAGLPALLAIAALTWRRLRATTHAPAHVVEMALTSALIPFLSVYWRLRGAWHFRVWFV
jgi:GT2 family glycosyltransferase